MSLRAIRRALLSVSDKPGLVELARALASFGVELISTGGTRKTLADAGLAVRDISEVTGFPEILDGRVKTLHPRVHAGILAIRDNQAHAATLQTHDIAPIDLVVCNLYPFEATVAKPGASHEEIVENIDVGGPSMIRAAAKNYHDVAVVTDPRQYDVLLEELKANKGATTLALREKLAAAAFARTAAYDGAISAYFAGRGETQDWPAVLELRFKRRSGLRYGENPHQKAAFYTEPGLHHACVASAETLHGKELSYNNLLDLDSALNLVREFAVPAAVVIKHNNPCGAAVGATLAEAFQRAYEGDPVSAYGGVLGFNRELDEATALQITEPGRFIECIIALGYSDIALGVLTTRPTWKKNVRLLRTGPLAATGSARAPRLPPNRRWAFGSKPRRAGGRFRPSQGRHEARADRCRDGRSAVRLAGRQARQEQRHRAGQECYGSRCRRGPDEPRGLRAHRLPQGWRARARQRAGFGRVLSLPGQHRRSRQSGSRRGGATGWINARSRSRASVR